MNNVTFSIIIPALNEEKYIAQCLDSILEQSYPQELIEVIVVNGMSTDNTESIVRSYAEKYPNIKLINNEKRITPISLNLGIHESKGEIVAILSGHSYISKDFVKNNVRNLTRRNVQCSGGPIKTISDNDTSFAISLAMSCPFGVGNALFRYSKKEMYVDTVAFGAYRREWLDKIGYFDEMLVRNQDDELNLRLRIAGGKILLSSDIESYYYSRGDLGKLWLQYYQYGFWKVCVIKKHRKLASLRHLIPSLFVLSIILGIIASLIYYPLSWLLLAIILLYIAAAVVSTIKISLKNGFKYFFKVLPVFPTMHISYGLGFLFGIFTFMVFRSDKAIRKNSRLSR